MELNTKAELHPELQEYLEESPAFGQILRHPLVFMVPYHGVMADMCNKQFQTKSEQIQKAIEEYDLGGIIAMYERAYRLDAYTSYAYLAEPEERAKVASWIYTDSENIYQYKRIWEIIFNEVLANDNREHMMSETEYKVFNNLPNELTVYRGYNGCGGVDSYSWTLNKDIAVWFANRFKRSDIDAHVVSATIKKEHVIAYLNGRNEEEIVLNYTKLENIQHNELEE